ncbi:hypothetical protein [uncultured Actinomyces sp.]|uniref:hypothetical protein n=1 Tax=uncultured Actinomyces sp. TaxID=249061 RepID=UPI000B200643|nr:hypothetical protein [uncultured Actinomyces sp.]
MWRIDDVPRPSPARATYIQCGGSTEAMTTEIRVTHEDDALPPAELLRRINV